MILVDSSVWIDFFNGKANRATAFLLERLGGELLVTGDLILTEVLQGFSRDKDYRKAFQLLGEIPLLTIGGKDIAVKAAQNYRMLRRKGVTVRGVVDVLIGTYCIEHSLPLLHSDRDFDAIAKHLKLSTALEKLH